MVFSWDEVNKRGAIVDRVTVISNPLLSSTEGKAQTSSKIENLLD